MDDDTVVIADTDLVFFVDAGGAATRAIGLTDAFDLDAERGRVTGAVMGRTREVRKYTGDVGCSRRRRRRCGLYWGYAGC
jgi:hypothetical protein